MVHIPEDLTFGHPACLDDEVVPMKLLHGDDAGVDAYNVMPPPPKAPESFLKFKCHCGKEFPSSTRYHKHIRLHSDLRLYVCIVPGCGKSYKRMTHLARHLTSHSEQRPHVCDFPKCGKSFVSKQKVTKHQKSHTALKCELCGKSFRKKDQLERHRKAHAKSSDARDVAPLRCPDCGRVVRDQATLWKHTLRCRAHKCEDCGEEFKKFSDYSSHRKFFHPKSHVCGECGKAYRRERYLAEHLRNVHGEHLYFCQEPGCGQEFACSSALRVHARVVHQGLRPFSCRICGDSFAYKNVLKKHIKNVHPAVSRPSLSHLFPRPSGSAQEMVERASAASSSIPIAPRKRQRDAVPISDAVRRCQGRLFRNRTKKFARYSKRSPQPALADDDGTKASENGVSVPDPPKPVAAKRSKVSRGAQNARKTSDGAPSDYIEGLPLEGLSGQDLRLFMM